MSDRRRPSGRLVAAAGSLAAVVFLAGTAAGRATGWQGPDDAPGPAAQVRTAAGSPGEASGSARVEVGGLPGGWVRSESGARAAGVAYASAEQTWLYLSDEAIAASISAVATEGAASRLTAQVTGSVRLLREALAASPGPVWWVVRPLAADVISYSSARATVAVWVVAVLSAVEVAVPQSRWVTVTVDLVWVGGDWRIDGLGERSGPTPVLDASDEPWPAAALADTLSGFELLEVGR